MTRLADTIATVHPLDGAAQAAAAERQSRLTKPPGSGRTRGFPFSSPDWRDLPSADP
jgi:hypothetical protein